jgi:hypothetical protein
MYISSRPITPEYFLEQQARQQRYSEALEREEALEGAAMFSPSLGMVHLGARAMGADPAPSKMSSGVALALFLGLGAAACVINYQVGKAIAPSREKAKRWGAIHTVVGFVPFGTVIMALASNSETGR